MSFERIKSVFGAALLGLVHLGLTIGLVGYAVQTARIESDFAVFYSIGVLVSAFVLLPVALSPLYRRLAQRLLLSTLLLPILLMGGCVERIEPGYVGIVVNSMGTDRGVQDFPAVTGWEPYVPFKTTIYEYPTFMQNAQWQGAEAISFNVAGGMAIKADLNVSYQILPDKVPSFYVKFRQPNIDNFSHGYLRNLVRDTLGEVSGGYSVEDVVGPKKEELLSMVKQRINQKVVESGVQVDQLGFLGAPELPPSMRSAINEKLEATQRAQKAELELRQTRAEAEKKIAEAEGEAKVRVAAAKGSAEARQLEADALAKARLTAADAEAKANDMISKSVTDQVLRWRNLDLQGEYLKRWDGRRPVLEGMSGSSNSPNLILPLPQSLFGQ